MVYERVESGENGRYQKVHMGTYGTLSRRNCTRFFLRAPGKVVFLRKGPEVTPFSLSLILLDATQGHARHRRKINFCVHNKAFSATRVGSQRTWSHNTSALFLLQQRFDYCMVSDRVGTF